MPIKLTELVLIYRREKIRFDGSDTAILECDKTANEIADDKKCDIFSKSSGVIVKTDCQPEELVSGLSYRFRGRWIEHERHGRQFHASDFMKVQPHGKAGTIRYLTITCAGNGVGRATAERLWEKFQGEAVRVLRETPEVAVAAIGMQHFTDDKAAAASVILKEESNLEAVHIDLMDILGGRGFPRNTMKMCIKEWGIKSAELLKKNAFLLRTFYPGRFLQIDKLYLDQGGNPTKLKRQALCAWHSIAKDNDGNTWHRPETVEDGIRSRVSGTEVQPIPAMILAKRAGLISVISNGDRRPWLAESRKAANERIVAEHVRNMLMESCQWPEVEGLDISEHQKSELKLALQSPIGLFGGSPGTGKSFSAAHLIKRIVDVYGNEMVAVCAPTGKAATRMSEIMTEHKVNKQASTIHRLLGVVSQSVGDGWGFVHNESNPLPFKYYVLDEGSMPDIDIMAAFLKALPQGAHLLIVGDINQLPPIGHGAFLRDMIAAGIPMGDLTELHRNSGSIVKACKAIRDGKAWEYDEELDPENGLNLILEETRNNAESLEAIVRTLHKLRCFGIDPIWDVQVLVSVNKKSELSRVEVNKRLQNELNPDGQRITGCPFRVNDKIIRIKRNTLMPASEDAPSEYNQDAVDGKVLVCNGEQGRILQVEAKRAFASFTGPDRIIIIPFGKNDNNDSDSDDENETTTGCDFDLGYGCTVHKYQGSECKVELWGLDDSGGAMRLGCRELFYTGISRAKYFAKHFGKKYTADAMCMRRSITKRKTFLKELIQGTIK